MTELDQSPIPTSRKRTLPSVVSRQKKSHLTAAFYDPTASDVHLNDLHPTEIAGLHRKQNKGVCKTVSGNQRLIVKEEVADDYDRIQLAVEVIKEEVEEVDESEAEQYPCSTEMVKQELFDESEAEQVSTSAIVVGTEMVDKKGAEYFPCGQCDEVFQSAFVRWKHMGSAHQNSYRCSLCNQEFATKELVRRHKVLERGCKRKVTIPRDCPTCGRRYTVMRDYYRHINDRCRKRPELTGVGQFQCSECGIVLHLERLLKAHRAFKHPQLNAP